MSRGLSRSARRHVHPLRFRARRLPRASVRVDRWARLQLRRDVAALRAPPRRGIRDWVSRRFARVLRSGDRVRVDRERDGLGARSRQARLRRVHRRGARRRGGRGGLRALLGDGGRALRRARSPRVRARRSTPARFARAAPACAVAARCARRGARVDASGSGGRHRRARGVRRAACAFAVAARRARARRVARCIRDARRRRAQSRDDRRLRVGGRAPQARLVESVSRRSRSRARGASQRAALRVEGHRRERRSRPARCVGALRARPRAARVAPNARDGRGDRVIGVSLDAARVVQRRRALSRLSLLRAGRRDAPRRDRARPLRHGAPDRARDRRVRHVRCGASRAAAARVLRQREREHPRSTNRRRQQAPRAGSTQRARARRRRRRDSRISPIAARSTRSGSAASGACRSRVPR